MHRPPRPSRLLPVLGLATVVAATLVAADRIGAAVGLRVGLSQASAGAMDAPGELRDRVPGLRATVAVAVGVPGLRGAAPPLAARRSLDADVLRDDAPIAERTANGDGWVARDAGEAAWLIEREALGTYIGELIARTDSALTRWPVRAGRPVQYWIQSGAGLPGWSPAHVRQVREAFTAWAGAGIPVHFAPTADSASADILVLWTPRFSEPISGKTRWIHDRRGWIRSAQVTLALRRTTGEVLDADAVHAIALHEVGHALGLDHTTDVANVMAPKVRVRELSAADRATVQLLYRLPPGSLRQ